MLDKRLFLAEMLRRTANVAVGASAVRGSPYGTAAAARAHLAKVRLPRFAGTKQQFDRALDEETRKLMRTLPQGARHWGLSRKLLNIFLRDAFYNRFLCSEYGLNRIEHWLELPLDSHVGKKLNEQSGSGDLPRWNTIRALTPELNRQFQVSALEIAKERGLSRVHLDLFFWRGKKT